MFLCPHFLYCSVKPLKMLNPRNLKFSILPFLFSWNHQEEIQQNDEWRKSSRWRKGDSFRERKRQRNWPGLWSFLLEISNVVEACSCQFIYLGAFQDLFYITKFKQNRYLKDDLKEQTKKLEILETKVSKSLLYLTSIATLKRSESISFRSWLNRLIF